MALEEKFLHAGLTWQDHIQHSAIYCLIHNDRATRKSLSKNYKDLEKYLALPYLLTEAEVQALLKRGMKNPKARSK